jgi:hypothetical protein
MSIIGTGRVQGMSSASSIWVFLIICAGFGLASAPQVFDDGSKQCPYCGGKIMRQAVRCRHCGSNLEGEELRPAPFEEIMPGEVRSVSRDILVAGELAFREGEAVVIEKVEPNANRPEYRYVVRSDRLQKKFQLSDKDIGPAPRPPSLTPGSRLTGRF